MKYEGFRTRAAAREYAAWLRRHPARIDRVRYGHGGQVRVVSAEEVAAERDRSVRGIARRGRPRRARGRER